MPNLAPAPIHACNSHATNGQHHPGTALDALSPPMAGPMEVSRDTAIKPPQALPAKEEETTE